ncbi:MAG: hypothetical protein SNJ62_05330 [Chloracidobacterium sp.]
MVGCRAQVRANGRGVNVGNVCANGNMDRHRRASSVGLNQNGLLSVGRLRRIQPAAQALTEANAIRRRRCTGRVETCSGFFRAAKRAAPQRGVHIFGGCAHQRDFKVVNGA